jgi:hypothetical protein
MTDADIAALGWRRRAARRISRTTCSASSDCRSTADVIAASFAAQNHLLLNRAFSVSLVLTAKTSPKAVNDDLRLIRGDAAQGRQIIPESRSHLQFHPQPSKGFLTLVASSARRKSWFQIDLVTAIFGLVLEGMKLFVAKRHRTYITVACGRK